ncbi:MAG: aminopeptidase [Thermoplasmata archaeon]|nr:MAG: aminopeptidase [Thermoplasmata archaeon]
MKDKRLEKLAEVLVKYSLEIKKGDLFIINGTVLTIPLVREVYRKALAAGAHPYVRLADEDFTEMFYKHASDQQLRYVSPLAKFEVKTIDARLSILGPRNTKNLTNTDPKKQAVTSAAYQELHQIFLDRAAKGELRWCLTQYPTDAAAQDANMSLQEYEDFVFKASHVDKRDPIGYWMEMKKKQDKIVKLLSKKKVLRVVAKDTDLTLSVEGRKWINSHGKENFPDGEVFTGPVENSANGYITYSFPISHGGREVEDVRLEFKKGKVVKATASKGEKFLHSMLTMDKGASRIGEFAFGTNYGIKKYTKNTLFDEKIGGTIHIAVGSGYPETGSKNRSGLHWDMVCDLRKDGEVYADGELIYKNGRFLSIP